MMMKEFLKTFEGMQAEQQWSRILNACLIVIILIIAILLFRKETIVVIKPWALSEDAFLHKEEASRGYKEAWAFTLSQLIGNINPKTVSFASERLGPMLSPAIYQNVMDIMHQQANDIKLDRISMRFEPRDVTYEKRDNKTFISGYSYIKGTAGDEKRSIRTYEFVISIANYAPIIDYIDVYKGPPRTIKKLKSIQLKEEKRKARENKNAHR